MSTEYEERSTKQTKIYRKLGQGITIFHEDQYPDVEYVQFHIILSLRR